MPKYKNRIKAPAFIEHTILDGQDKPVGRIRIKPSNVLWKKKGAGKFWNVSLDEFINWITDPKTNAKRTKS